MSAYNPLAEKAADSTDIKTAFPAGTIRLGVDGEGAVHYVSRIEDTVFVVLPEETIELQEPAFDPDQLEALRDVLELDDDASLETVVESIEDLHKERQQLIAYLEGLNEIVNFASIFDESPDLDTLKETQK